MGEMERRAHRCWEAGGGWRGEKRRRRAKSEAKMARRAAEQSRRFKRHLNQGDGPVSGLSGSVLEDVGEHILVEIEPRQSQRAKRATTVQSARGLERRLFESGRGFDKWDRWRVERVAEVRKRRSSGRLGTEQGVLEARLRWVGRHPSTGLPYPDKWVEIGARDKEGVLIMNPALAREARAMAAIKFATSAPPRAHAAASAQAPPVAPRPCRKWRGVLRGVDDEEEEDGKEAERRRVRRRVTIREDEEWKQSRVEKRAAAWADLRRQRGASQVQSVRRCVVRDESSESDGTEE